MHVIARNTVVLNEREMLAKELHEHFLDEGDSMPRATCRVIACYPGLSDKFVAYLGGEIVPEQADLVRASLLRCPGPIASAQALQRRIMDGPRIVR